MPYDIFISVKTTVECQETKIKLELKNDASSDNDTFQGNTFRSVMRFKGIKTATLPYKRTEML